MTDELLETIAEAGAEVGMQQLARWLPAEWHEELRELLFDLVFSSLVAHRDAKRNWFEVPAPSVN